MPNNRPKPKADSEFESNRRPACVNGHQYVDGSWSRDKRGCKTCLLCKRLAAAKHKAKVAKTGGQTDAEA